MSRRPNPTAIAQQDAIVAALREHGGLLRVKEIAPLAGIWSAWTVAQVEAGKRERPSADQARARVLCEQLVRAGKIEKLRGAAVFSNREDARFASGQEVAYRYAPVVVSVVDSVEIEKLWDLPSYETER